MPLYDSTQESVPSTPKSVVVKKSFVGLSAGIGINSWCEKGELFNLLFTLKILPFMAASRVQSSETRNLLDTIHQNQLLTSVTSVPEIPSIELSSVDLGDVVIEDP